MNHDPETSPNGQAALKPTRLDMPRTRMTRLPSGWIHFTAVTVLLTSQAAAAGNATILEIENKVQTALSKTADWKDAAVRQTLSVGDRIRTRQRSRATLALTGLYTVRMDQFTTVEITPGLVTAGKPRLDLTGGAAFIFSREPDGEMDVRLPTANAALRGTQLFVRVLPDGTSQIQVLEGMVNLENPHGRLSLNAGESGEAINGRAPRKTAVIEANNLLQWALYYPAVIDPTEFSIGKSRSFDAYQKGNLLAAVATLPAEPPAGNDERVFHAGVLLSVGRVDEAHGLLNGVPATHSGKRAILRMIQAVRGGHADAWDTDAITSASEALAESYYLQSQALLEAATESARRATVLSPENGFAWTRLAELEFSAGRTREALAADRPRASDLLRKTPAPTRSWGSSSAHDNRIREARSAFERSVALDGGFGNGWLGLGLVKIKQGDLEAGRIDLQTAATVEPTVSIFHSYLGKAMSQDGRGIEAEKDLTLARQLDPRDPTPLLYWRSKSNATTAPTRRSAISGNPSASTTTAGSIAPDSCSIRTARCATPTWRGSIRTAGMKELAVREATRAVENDYTNPSAHLFLANSFDALRDPDRTLLRYETPWFNELLLANLLSPVGGGPLSQLVSQQEYSKLLEADGIGGSLLTEWRSTSELRTTASVFGTHGNVSYGIDAYYRNDDGDRLNSDIDLREIYGQLKWQPTAGRHLLFPRQMVRPEKRRSVRDLMTTSRCPRASGFEENQEPGLLLAGWNHRWRPGSNTLFLVGRLAASQRLADPASGQAARLPRHQRSCARTSSARAPAALMSSPIRHCAGSVGREPGRQSCPTRRNCCQAIAAVSGFRRSPRSCKAAHSDFLTRREWEIYGAEVQHIEQTGSPHAAVRRPLAGGNHRDRRAPEHTSARPLPEAFSHPPRTSTWSPTTAGPAFTPTITGRCLPSLTLIGGIALGPHRSSGKLPQSAGQHGSSGGRAAFRQSSVSPGASRSGSPCAEPPHRDSAA